MKKPKESLGVQVPNNYVLEFWVVVIILQVLVSICLLGTWTLRDPHAPNSGA